MIRLWTRKKIVLYCIVGLMVVLGILGMRAFKKYVLGIEEYYYRDTQSMSEKVKKQVSSYSFLGFVEFPEEAKDIYIYMSIGRSSYTYCSMILPGREQINRLAEGFVGVPLSAFKEGVGEEDKNILRILSGVRHVISDLRRGEARRGFARRWNLLGIKNGKYFAVTWLNKEEFKRLRMKIYGESEENAGGWYSPFRDHYMAVDLDTNKVYLYATRGG